MNLVTKTAIASAAIIATAIVPVSSAFAQVRSAPESGRYLSHKGGPYHYKKGPKVHYPRGYHKHKPPYVVHKGKNNGAALGLLGFAAGAIFGGTLANGS
ncbi:MAG: hypothetical protein GY789_25455 [Hyphomicrobiales bacterium]|nr:hypothetical protein [Hyphomicrobiales bacterium]MCP4999907.1 hypothetical protein [Hyphomicrobiales bacterium]